MNTGLIPAGSPASLTPQKLKAGRPCAHIGTPSLFLRAVNDNEAAMQKKATNSRCHNDPRQTDFLSLLDSSAALLEPVTPNAETGDPDQKIRDLINRAIKSSPLDRDQIAACMSATAGREITKTMLDCWTGASRPHRFPLALAPAFCRAVGNTVLLAGLVEMCGCRMIEGPELQLARLGQLWLFIRQAQEEEKQIIADLPMFREARHG